MIKWTLLVYSFCLLKGLLIYVLIYVSEKALTSRIFHEILHEQRYSLGVTWSLECWQCIGENCNMHPDEVHEAEKKTCRKGESCLVNQANTFLKFFFRNEFFFQTKPTKSF